MTEKEAYAIVFRTQQFRVYLLGRHFQLVMDHNALSWLHSMEPKGRLARWILDFQEFNFSIVSRAGHLHNNADALSRLVQSLCEPSAQSSASTADLKSSNKPELMKTTINVKLTSGRIVSITFEGSLPLKTDSTRALVTDARQKKKQIST